MLREKASLFALVLKLKPSTPFLGGKEEKNLFLVLGQFDVVTSVRTNHFNLGEFAANRQDHSLEFVHFLQGGRAQMEGIFQFPD